MLPRWILSLTASFLLPATGEVVTNFKTCTQFFLNHKPPALFPMAKNLATICQYYKGKYRFATMYDRNGRIPLFSAYKYQPGGRGRNNDWKIEPQVSVWRKQPTYCAGAPTQTATLTWSDSVESLFLPIQTRTQSGCEGKRGPYINTAHQ